MKPWHGPCNRWRAMKINPLKISLLVCLLGSAAAVPVLAQSDDSMQPHLPADAGATAVLRGKIIAISTSAMIVDGRTVALTHETSFLANGRSISLDDVHAGDEVSVTTTADDNRVITALAVEVTSRGK